jgi:hypothetical protein
MTTAESGINRGLFWAVAAVAVLALVANGILIATRSNGKGARVLGRRLVTPSPVPTLDLASLPPIVSQTAPPAPAPAPAPAETEAPVAPAEEEEEASAPEASGSSLVCRNSTNSACGRFYWSPSPGVNKPLEIRVAWSPERPEAGDVVTFTVTLADPDAKITSWAVGYGDPSGARITACSVPARYGPWTPPAREAGKVTLVYHHAYSEAGSYVAEFFGRSGVCGSPYGAETALHVPITVDEPAPPDPEPSPSESPLF